MAATPIERIRVFNRTVTERLGVLDEHYLGRGRPLGEARLLWEIGGAGKDGAEVRALRARLGLDSGYLSRLLASLEGQGLIRVEASPADRRVRRVKVTRAGAREHAELDRRSDASAAAILDALAPAHRERLVAAMEQVERYLAASMIEIAAEPADSDDARACFGRYFAELDRRFEHGFAVERALPAGAPELTPPAGLLLVARLRGEPVGCGGLKLHGDEPAEIKRLWISPAVRGAGLGRRLLGRLEEAALAAGADAVRLDTNRSLTEAIRLYRESGYREIAAFNDEPHADHWFEKSLR
jgi:DNA-binding MarR family transcriptional regulator/GNAT superfamily N-acetyltransferase